MHLKHPAAPYRKGGRLPAGSEHESLVQRLRREIAEAGLDCGCQEAANEILDRVGAEDAIVIVLALLGELDELMPDEPDRSAFHEIAGLFQDVADFAAFGASAARRTAGEGNS